MPPFKFSNSKLKIDAAAVLIRLLNDHIFGKELFGLLWCLSCTFFHFVCSLLSLLVLRCRI